MKTIKSKKLDKGFEDYFYGDELDYDIKKKKKKHKSSKKSSKKKHKKKINKQVDLASDYFIIDSKKEKKALKNKSGKYEYKKSFLGRIADSFNVNANVDVQITDDAINNLVLIASSIITGIITKNK